jgi:hypothetical protein
VAGANGGRMIGDLTPSLLYSGERAGVRGLLLRYPQGIRPRRREEREGTRRSARE